MVKAGEKTNIQDTTGWGLEMHRQGSGELESVTKTHVDYICICSVFLSALASSPAVSETLENAALKRWCSSSSSMKVTGEIEIWKVMIPFVRLCGSSNAKLSQKWRCKMIKVEKTNIYKISNPRSLCVERSLLYLRVFNIKAGLYDSGFNFTLTQWHIQLCTFDLILWSFTNFNIIWKGHIWTM